MSAKSATEMKGLQTRISEAETELRLASEDAAQAQRKVSGLQRRIDDLKKQLAELNSGGLKVSEHCLLRFAERVYGFDADKAAKEIIEILERKAEALGNGIFPLDGYGVSAVVKNKTVITIK